MSAKTGHRTLDVCGPSVDPSTICQSLNKNGLGGRFAIKKPRNGNGVKRLLRPNVTQCELIIVIFLEINTYNS